MKRPKTASLDPTVLPIGMIYLILFLTAVVSRIMPHPPNVTAIVAVAVIAGAYVSPRWAWLIPLTAILATDVLFLEPYGWREMTFVYLGHAIAIGLGLAGSWFFVRRRSHRAGDPAGKSTGSPTRSLLDGYPLCAAAACASVAFWTVSNFGSWLAFYPRTPEGLANCYWLALPFLGNQLAGDVLFTGGMFLAAEAVRGAFGPAVFGAGTRV